MERGGGGEIADKIGYSEFFIIFKLGFPVGENILVTEYYNYTV